MAYDPERHNRKSNRLKGYDYSQPGFYYVTICTQDRVERFGDVSDDEMVLNDAGEIVDEKWNLIPARYGHVVLDKYQVMPNHMHGIVQIVGSSNGENKSFGNGNVGTGLVPVLNDGDGSVENGPIDGPIDGDKTNANTSNNDIAASGRMGTRPIPTPLYDMIGTFKSLTQNDYAFHVRKNGWPPFRKRLWQLRFHDHIIRNRDDAEHHRDELNRIRKYIENNPRNWVDDENNPENFGNDDRKDS